MVSEKMLKYFRKYFHDYNEKFPHDFPSMNMQNICPVIIEFCDASAHSRCFSEAVVDYRLDNGIPLSYFFRVGHNELMQYILGKKEEANRAIMQLENFVVNIEKHTNCLKCLFDKKERMRRGITSECHIQGIIAAHLFGPLAGDTCLKIGNTCSSKGVRECPVCKEDITAMLDDTSLGNSNVWHGFADLFVDGSIVKIAEEPELKTRIECESSETFCDGGTGPFRKKRRFEECHDSYNSDGSYESDSFVEADENCIDAKTISQGLAQTIVNAFCENLRCHPLKTKFVPSFIVSCDHVKITMYNCGLDWLMMSSDLTLFVNLDVTKDAVLDLSTILSIWYALNFEMYVEDFDLLETMIPVSNFRKMVGSKHSLYENHCSKPMKVKADVKREAYKLNPASLSIVAKQLDTQVEHCKQLKQFLNEMA